MVTNAMAPYSAERYGVRYLKSQTDGPAMCDVLQQFFHFLDYPSSYFQKDSLQDAFKRVLGSVLASRSHLKKAKHWLHPVMLQGVQPFLRVRWCTTRQGARNPSLMYIYIYMYICIYTYICVYTHTRPSMIQPPACFEFPFGHQGRGGGFRAEGRPARPADASAAQLLSG